MRIRADFAVGHPAGEVWALLAGHDGAGCVPGLTVEGPGCGALALDVDARHLVFEGKAAVASDLRARTVTLEARGVERAGRGRARTTLLLRVDEDGLFSTVNVDADLHLSGEVASISRLIAEAVYRMADGVAVCIEARLGSVREEPPAAAEPGPGSGTVRPGLLRRAIDRLRGG